MHITYSFVYSFIFVIIIWVSTISYVSEILTFWKYYPTMTPQCPTSTTGLIQSKLGRPRQCGVRAQDTGIWLSAKNLARTATRLLPHYEWQLHLGRARSKLRSCLGTPLRRSLSSFTDTHLRCCNSQYYDPDSIGVDVLAQLEWTSLNISLRQSSISFNP